MGDEITKDMPLCEVLTKTGPLPTFWGKNEPCSVAEFCDTCRNRGMDKSIYSVTVSVKATSRKGEPNYQNIEDLKASLGAKIADKWRKHMEEYHGGSGSDSVMVSERG